MTKQIYITAQDRQRLLSSLTRLIESLDKRQMAHILYLQKEVERACVITDHLVTPKDIITMNSRVRLRNLSTQDTMDCTLVYPPERSPEDGRISVLAPLGAAMLGYRVGDSFTVELPRGPVEFLAEELLYQPESCGDHHL